MTNKRKAPKVIVTVTRNEIPLIPLSDDKFHEASGDEKMISCAHVPRTKKSSKINQNMRENTRGKQKHKRHNNRSSRENKLKENINEGFEFNAFCPPTWHAQVCRKFWDSRQDFLRKIITNDCWYDRLIVESERKKFTNETKLGN